MNYKEFPKDVNAGERVLLDDGKLIFEVISTNRKNEVKAKVIQGGPLKSKKGVNLPNTNVSLPALTKRILRMLFLQLVKKLTGSRYHLFVMGKICKIFVS